MVLHPLIVGALVYPSIDSNLVTLATLIPWSDSVHTHTFYPFLSKPHIEVNQDGRNRSINKRVASFK